MAASNKISTDKSRSVGRLVPFGPTPLLEGEDAAGYDELLARVSAAVKPVDMIDEIYIADVVSLEWEVLRWRRLKLTLLRARGLKGLEKFLHKKLEYDLYSEHFVSDLTEILQQNLPEDQAKDAPTLAREFARNEPDADEKVDEVLDSIGMNMDDILDGARARKAKELVQEYVRGESDAVTLVDEVLSGASKGIDTIMADALVFTLDHIERIDRLTAIAESRRNASLREIDRRRVVLGEALRRSVQEIEDSEFKVIETTQANGKKRGLTSDRKIKANRANAQASTGPKTTRGRASSARNALRHSLSLPVRSDPALSEEAGALAREIAGPDTNTEIQQLARHVAEAQIDLRRVRYARHQLLSDALADPDFVPLKKRRLLARLLRMVGPDTPISDALRFRIRSPEGPDKLAAILAAKTQQLLAMDRYERRALSRRKFAIRALDKARRLPN